MERRRERSRGEQRRRRSVTPQRKRSVEVLTYEKLKKMPVNLRKKAIREARNRNEVIAGKQQQKRRQRRPKQKAAQPNFEQCEHKAMLAATSQELQQILASSELLSDLPYDCTATELLGEIAIAKGQATTIYVERLGLSTLTVVLHQKQPTIANLKHAIAEISRAEHKRTQRERYEERLKRRRRRRGDTTPEDEEEQQPQQQVDSMARSTGELVCSALRNGHEHRAHVSWRFLWRAFTLYNVDSNQPISDENGRAQLTALGIENAATLKFVHRVKYFGRQRQS